MADEGMELIQKRVQQAIALIERLRQENQNLKDEIARLQDESRKVKQEADEMREEKEAIKGKIDIAMSMLDKVDLEEEADTDQDSTDEE